MSAGRRAGDERGRLCLTGDECGGVRTPITLHTSAEEPNREAKRGHKKQFKRINISSFHMPFSWFTGGSSSAPANDDTLGRRQHVRKVSLTSSSASGSGHAARLADVRSKASLFVLQRAFDGMNDVNTNAVWMSTLLIRRRRPTYERGQSKPTLRRVEAAVAGNPPPLQTTPLLLSK